MTPMTTTIGQIFRIPQQVHQGDFVLKLTEGVDAQHAEATLRDYVVTEQLVGCFDQALGLIQAARQGCTSKGAYLHGSFGSGKSHFMAVLSLLLDGNVHARAIPELASVVQKHDNWLGRQRVLVVPLHLIGAPSLEAAVLGGYARYVRERHPEAATPGFYRGDQLFADAKGLRERMGDEAFFEGLNARAAAASGWGALSGGWEAHTFEHAMRVPAGDAERARLVGDLVDAYYGAAAALASQEEGFVAMDDGLVELSRHAQALGYDAVVLFLDEVMLWLASYAGDEAFLTREAQKLAKLVEAGNMARPIPLVSFLARQRDLRELVNEHLAGAEQLAVADVLKWWQGRFDTVTLEDQNLPAIIEKRLLRPVDGQAHALLANAHAETEKIRAEVLNVLLAREGDREMFRKVYPFSPVLVQALVALSALLQRERTALKLLVQLLVQQRDLPLGDVMPVGELWDVVEHGDEPFSAVLRERFVQAKRLWRTKLLPMLEEEKANSGLAPEAAARMFRNDARLLKTLLLAALAEGVEALDQLTPARLAALNHGTVRSPIEGQEARMVLDKLRRWAGRVGEIRLSNDTRSTVALHLVGVDTDVILQNALAADNHGARVQKIRALLFELAGIPSDNSAFGTVREVEWRGTVRQVEVIFRNVRELAPEQFRPQHAPWRLVIDYPFDDQPNRSPRDDRAVVQDVQTRGETSQALIWLPAFFTPAAQDDLGKLVLLEYVLSGNQLDTHASHLSAQDRAQAKLLLQNQREVLRQTVSNALLAAYGLTTSFREKIDESHGLETHFFTLPLGLHLQTPVAATFAEALDQIVAQALAWEFPAHPEFTTELKPGVIRKVWAWVQRAAPQPGGRVEVDRADREDVRRIAVPLQLGDMGDAHFVLKNDWNTHFARCQARDGVTTLTVGRVRGWLDQPKAGGLPTSAQNLVILTWALQTDRSFHLHGSSTAVEATTDRLLDDYELRTQTLPDERLWGTAVRYAADLFGLALSQHRSAQSLASLVQQIDEQVKAIQAPVQRYAQSLDAALRRVGVDPATSDRRRTAQAARDLVVALQGKKGEAMVLALANATIATSAPAMAGVLKQSDALERGLHLVQGELVTSLRALSRELFGARADALLGALHETLRRDEYVQGLQAEAQRFNDEGLKLLTEAATLAKPIPHPSTPAAHSAPVTPSEFTPAGGTGHRVSVHKKKMVAGSDLEAVVRELRADVTSSGDARVEIEWRILGA